LTIDVVVVVVVSTHHHLHSRGGFKECREKFCKKNAKNTRNLMKKEESF
jgi:hypothetical protein